MTRSVQTATSDGWGEAVWVPLELCRQCGSADLRLYTWPAAAAVKCGGCGVWLADWREQAVEDAGPVSHTGQSVGGEGVGAPAPA